MVSTIPVSVVVPTFRRPDALQSTLRSLVSLDYPPDSYEVIVVDDGSNDGTAKVVETFQHGLPNVTYAAQPNGGVARARNHGARIARGDTLIFVDDDIIVEPSHVRQHLATMESFGDCLVNGHWEFTPEVEEALRATPFGRFRIGIEKWVKEGIAKRPLREGCVEPSAVTACNLAVRRERFLGLGGFDESFPFAGYEDQEFSYRAKAAGCSLVYNEAIHLLHNDHRITLRQFCERQRQGALTAVILACKHPEEFGSHPLLTQNGPIARGDGARLAAKKAIKSVLSTRPALAVLFSGIGVVERRRASAWVLPKAYWSMTGLFIFRGIRQGLREAGAGAEPNRHERLPTCRG